MPGSSRWAETLFLLLSAPLLAAGRVRPAPARVVVPAGATTVDGRGKFLLPGLADVHARPRWPDAAQDSTPLNPSADSAAAGPLFLLVATA